MEKKKKKREAVSSVKWVEARTKKNAWARGNLSRKRGLVVTAVTLETPPLHVLLRWKGAGRVVNAAALVGKATGGTRESFGRG